MQTEYKLLQANIYDKYKQTIKMPMLSSRRRHAKKLNIAMCFGLALIGIFVASFLYDMVTTETGLWLLDVRSTLKWRVGKVPGTTLLMPPPDPTADTKSIEQLKHIIIKQPPAPIHDTDKVVLFAMFTADGKISDYTRYYVECLAKKFDYVYGIVATNETLPASLYNVHIWPWLLELFSATILRENHGLDFAAWALALRSWPQIWTAKQLLFANDSVFGPLDPAAFDAMLARIDASESDFVGLTESLTGINLPDHNGSTSLEWHYQSYFFVLQHAGIRNRDVQRFWNNTIVSLYDKSEIIRRYETSMTIIMKSFGLKTEALFSLVMEMPYSSLSPTLVFCKELLDKGFPFIKRELFRDPILLPHVKRVDFAKATAHYPLTLPPLPADPCLGVTPTATINKHRISADTTVPMGFVDAVTQTATGELCVRGWSSAHSLIFVTDYNFASVRIATMQRSDVVAAGESDNACSGFIAHLTPTDSCSIDTAAIKLCVFGKKADSIIGELVNDHTPACDADTRISVDVSLRYNVCEGLCNQLYSHFSAWALARELDVDVYLPPALYRRSFLDYNADYNTTIADPDYARSKAVWKQMPLARLIDVKSLRYYARKQGLRIRRSHAAANITHLTLRIDLPLRAQMQLSHMACEVRRQLRRRLLSIKAQNISIILELECTFLFVADLYKHPLVRNIAANLTFSPKIIELAHRITHSMGSTGGDYNGIHLRIELDALHAISLYGGRESYLQDYRKALDQANFDPMSKVYVASGLPSYGDAAQINSTIHNMLTLAGDNVVYKEKYISREELSALTIEEQALIDFVVLKFAKLVVGISWSSFSYLLRDMRTLAGYKYEATILAGRQIFPESYFRIIPF